MSFEPESDQSCSDVLDAADNDRRVGQFAASLEKFEWFFEKSRYERGMGGVRLSFALGYWMELASVYPPAMTAFLALRDRTESRCRNSRGEFKAFHELSALNRYLDSDDRTVDLFLEIARTNQDAAKSIYHVAEPLLVERGLYEECGPFLEIDQTVATNISAFRIGKIHAESFAGHVDAPPPLAEEMFREKIVRLVALLAISNRLTDAQVVMDRATAELESIDFRSELMAALSGHLPER